MSDAPEKLVVIWTVADADTMPATVPAHTQKSRYFVNGAPRWMDGKRVEYTRTDLIQPMIDKAVAEALERVLEIIEDLATVDGCFGDADEAIRALIPPALSKRKPE